MKILTIVGARPQFIKASVVSLALSDAGVEEALLHTGQHYDENMSAVFFQELRIPAPKHYLGVGSGPHGQQTGRMLEAIEAVLMAEAPTCVLVYGDTNSTLAGALAATKLHIPVAHVEAGLRSFNRRMPEEINRVLTDHVADILFAPTDDAVVNLKAEGVPPERITRVGDVMYDVALRFGAIARAESTVLQRVGVRAGNFVLATIHRAENTDVAARLESILTAFHQISRHMPVVLPLHPRTRSAIIKSDLGQFLDGILVTEPLGYLDMVMLEASARCIATDSGGVQKEAYFHGVPCVTLRDETEWGELVGAGWNELVHAADARKIEDAILSSFDSGRARTAIDAYGSGDASMRIVEELRRRYSS